MPDLSVPGVTYGSSYAASVAPGSILDIDKAISYTESIAVGSNVVIINKTMRDDGAGSFPDSGAAVYATGALTFAPAAYYYASSWNETSDTWGQIAVHDTFTDGSAVTVTYALDTAADTAATESVTQADILIDLTPYTGDPIVPGSVMFSFCGSIYVDRAGALYRDPDPLTGVGTLSGSIDYTSGRITVTDWIGGAAPAFALLSLLTVHGYWTTTEAQFRTAGSPLRPASTYVQALRGDGALLNATANQNGDFATADITGSVDQTMGVVSLTFSDSVFAETLQYSCVVLSSVPVDASLLGINPVRLPVDGRMPFVRAGDFGVMHHTADESLPNPVTLGATYTMSRDRLAAAALLDSNGTAVDGALWAADLDLGTVTIGAAADLSAYAQPLVCRNRIEHRCQVSDVQISGALAFSPATDRDFPSGSYFSTAHVFGDLSAAVPVLFEQKTWNTTAPVWQDSLLGSDTTWSYNAVDYPPVVTNEGAVTERWRISFTSASTFVIIGETVGQLPGVWTLINTSGVLTVKLDSGTPSANCTPINTLTNQPYFSLPAQGFGTGQAAGDQLRMNTRGAEGPTWFARAVLQGALTTGDKAEWAIAGDID